MVVAGGGFPAIDEKFETVVAGHHGHGFCRHYRQVDLLSPIKRRCFGFLLCPGVSPDALGLNGHRKWIWKDARAAEKTEASTLYWRKEINLPVMPTEAV